MEASTSLTEVASDLNDEQLLALASPRRDVKPLEGAIYAETIPFSETRDYVKKVMSNAVFYQTVMTGSSPSLKIMLGTIGPKAGQSDGVPDLP